MERAILQREGEDIDIGDDDDDGAGLVEVFAWSLFVEVVVVVIFLLLGVSSVLIHLLTVVAATFLSPTLRLLMWLICHCGEDEASDQFGLGLQRFDSG